MTKQRSEYIYRFAGHILQLYRRKNSAYTQHFYQLKVKLDAHAYLQKIFAFKTKTSPTIWDTLESHNYVGKQYLLACRNYQGSYYLVDLKEMANPLPKELKTTL